MFHTQGIVLKKSPYREFDGIFTIYTKDFGKIEAIGRGIKKPAAKLANHLQVFDFSEIEFVLGKNFKVLTGANADKNLLSEGAVDFFDLLDSLTAIDDPDENIWNLVLKYILNHEIRLSSDVILSRAKRSEESTRSFAPLRCAQDDKKLVVDNYFQFQLLSLSGFSPDILSFNAKLPSTGIFLKLFAKSDEKEIADLKISKEELDDVKNAMGYFKDVAFGYLR